MKTIRFFTLSSLFILIPLLGNAEDAKDAKDGDKVGGIRFGYHQANMFKDGEKVPAVDNLSGFYVGLARNTQLAPMIHLGTGLEYFQNGYKVDDDNKLVYHTLSIPINIKIKLGPAFALSGFGANFKVSEKVHVLGESTTPAEADKAKFFDVPFFVGAGVQILFISVEARYHWGLIDVSTDGYANQYFQIGAALSF